MIKQALFNKKLEVGISELSDGNMRFFGGEDEISIIKNQEKLGEALNLPGENIVRVRTIYGDRKNFTDYHEITSENLPAYTVLNSESQIPVSDGIVTTLSNVGILLPLADCLGIVVFDEEHHIIGLLHSGRQNIEQYGPEKFIKYFTKKFNSDPKKLKIYFSPHALNYQIHKFNNKTLSQATTDQLADAGILLGNITDFKIDTVENDKLPSHSSGDKTKRFAIIVKQS